MLWCLVCDVVALAVNRTQGILVTSERKLSVDNEFSLSRRHNPFSFFWLYLEVIQFLKVTLVRRWMRCLLLTEGFPLLLWQIPTVLSCAPVLCMNVSYVTNLQANNTVQNVPEVPVSPVERGSSELNLQGISFTPCARRGEKNMFTSSATCAADDVSLDNVFEPGKQKWPWRTICSGE